MQPITPIDWRRLALALPTWPVLVFALVVAVGSYLLMPAGGGDWNNDIAPGAHAWWPEPWQEGLPLIPWGALLLSPLGAAPGGPATALVNGAGVIILAVVVRKYGGRDWYTIPLLLSPPGLFMFRQGQTDMLVLSGLLLHNGVDLVLLTIKPQVALGVVAARVSRAGACWWRYLVPIAITLLVSLVLWPAWPFKLWAEFRELQGMWWNVGPWPWGLPVGAWLLWRAWRTGRDEWGILATPLLFPYVNFQTTIVAVAVAMVRWPRYVLPAWIIFVAAAFAFWIYLALQGPAGP